MLHMPWVKANLFLSPFLDNALLGLVHLIRTLCWCDGVLIAAA